jgi:4'-phosphopantetheinyl transferase
VAVSFPAPETSDLAICWTDVRPLRDSDVAAWAHALPEPERLRLSRYRHPRSAAEFLAGRLLVRTWLAAVTGVSAGVWRFGEGPRGRPTIVAPHSPLHFNLAHSGGVVACILTDTREAGVDVEDLGRRQIDPRLWHRFCAPSEIADIEHHAPADRPRRFLTYWTLKEAYLKARGVGIAVQLADVVFTVGGTTPRVHFERSLAGTDTSWAFGVTPVASGHLVSWAVPHDLAGPTPNCRLVHVPVAELEPTV